MQAAIDHLENSKVLVEALGIEMVPLSEAYRALELSIDSQLDEAIKQIEEATNINLIDENLDND